MPSLFVTRSMMRHKSEEKEGAGPGPKSLVQCPHCEKHFAHGGEVEAPEGTSPESGAHEFDREHGEEMGYADRTRKYDRDFAHYYGAGEASSADPVRHRYARGGRVDQKDKNKPALPKDRSQRPPPRPPDAQMESTPSYDDYRHGFYDNGGRVARAHRLAHKGGESNDSFTSYLAKRRAARGR